MLYQTPAGLYQPLLQSWSATTPACLPLVLSLPGDGFHQHAENMGVAVIKAGTPIKMVIYAMSLAGDPATPGARR
jgi:hypothetical protein